MLSYAVQNLVRLPKWPCISPAPDCQKLAAAQLNSALPALLAACSLPLLPHSSNKTHRAKLLPRFSPTHF